MTPIFLTLTVAVAAPLPRDRPKKEPPSVVGEWVRVGHTEAGAAVPPDRETHRQVFTADGRWNYSYGAHKGAAGLTFVADPRQSPPTIDINPGPGGIPNSYRGIYKVEGDTLTLCLVSGDRDRPRSFESTPDRPTTIWVFKRVKPTD